VAVLGVVVVGGGVAAFVGLGEDAVEGVVGLGCLVA